MGKNSNNFKRPEGKKPEVDNLDIQNSEGQIPEVKKVKMTFSQDKFYNDLSNPKYIKGEIYEIEGEDQIQRWLKRGGQIVGDEVKEVKISEKSDKEEKTEEAKGHEEVLEGEDEF